MSATRKQGLSLFIHKVIPHLSFACSNSKSSVGALSQAALFAIASAAEVLIRCIEGGEGADGPADEATAASVAGSLLQLLLHLSAASTSLPHSRERIQLLELLLMQTLAPALMHHLADSEAEAQAQVSPAGPIMPQPHLHSFTLTFRFTFTFTLQHTNLFSRSQLFLFSVSPVCGSTLATLQALLLMAFLHHASTPRLFANCLGSYQSKLGFCHRAKLTSKLFRSRMFWDPKVVSIFACMLACLHTVSMQKVCPGSTHACGQFPLKANSAREQRTICICSACAEYCRVHKGPLHAMWASTVAPISNNSFIRCCRT